MPRHKRQMPTSIRLSPEAVTYVERLQAATGWSVSKVLEHMVMLGSRVQNEDANGVKLMRMHIRTAIESYTAIKKAEAIATEARSNVRKAAAAVKGAK